VVASSRSSAVELRIVLLQGYAAAPTRPVHPPASPAAQAQRGDASISELVREIRKERGSGKGT